MEQSIDVGLVKGHAYGITMVKAVTLEGTHRTDPGARGGGDDPGTGAPRGRGTDLGRGSDNRGTQPTGGWRPRNSGLRGKGSDLGGGAVIPRLGQ